MLRVLQNKFLPFFKLYSQNQNLHKNSQFTIMIAWNTMIQVSSWNIPTSFRIKLTWLPPPVRCPSSNKCLPRSGELKYIEYLSFTIWTVYFSQEVIRASEIDLARPTFRAFYKARIPLAYRIGTDEPLEAITSRLTAASCTRVKGVPRVLSSIERGLYVQRDVHYRANINMALDKPAQMRQVTRFAFIFVNFHLLVNRCEILAGEGEGERGMKRTHVPQNSNFFSFFFFRDHSFNFRVIYLFLNLLLLLNYLTQYFICNYLQSISQCWNYEKKGKHSLLTFRFYKCAKFQSIWKNLKKSKHL